MKFKQLLSAFRRPIEKYLLNFRVQHALYLLSPSTINCHLHVSVKDNVYVRRFSETQLGFPYIAHSLVVV